MKIFFLSFNNDNHLYNLSLALYIIRMHLGINPSKIIGCGYPYSIRMIRSIRIDRITHGIIGQKHYPSCPSHMPICVVKVLYTVRDNKYKTESLVS
jgi:hypothetical protein